MSCGVCGENCTCTPASSRPPREPVTLDAARVHVARIMIGVLEDAIAATTSELEAAIAKGKDGADEQEGRNVLAAAAELRASLVATVQRLERPRILRPDRGIKVVRS